MRKLIAALALLAVVTGCGSKSGNTPAPDPSDTAPPQVTPVPADLPPAGAASGANTDFAKAVEAIRKGDYLGAAAGFRKVVAAEPDNVSAWSWLSFALVRTQRPSLPGRPGVHKEAIDSASKAVLLKADHPGANYNLGLALLADGQYTEAIAPLRQAVGELQDQERMTAYGLALIGAGKAADAIPVCRAADKANNQFWLAKTCLELTGEGLKRVNPAEAAVGDWLYEQAKGFVWKGKPGADGVGQMQNISPPWTCAYQYASGFRELQLGCSGDGQTYAWEVASQQAGTTPSAIGVGTPLSKVADVHGTSTFRSGRSLHYLVSDLHMVIYLTENETVERIIFERPMPIFAIDKLLRGETGPAPLTADEGKLAGIEIGMPEADVEKLLGAAVSSTETALGVYDRVYKDGNIRVHYAASSRRVLHVDVLAGSYKTARGIGIGSPVTEVRRLYGQPQIRGELYEYYYFSGGMGVYYLSFEVRSNKVARIRAANYK